ncbi:replication protein [Intestinimonas massiliensis (ex Afouda et al. 2020)]|uniref:replication protein n=1 Tax=Intestinimonas massiliensis (ex Afouda et al. 2020) TaxID=1673721 RepID=UPI0010316088|nr:replication protein [Intestinimonas massiliensis (ex Afouda et al. 2020)]
MPRESASRKYQLTINNPQEHGLTHLVLRAAIDSLTGCLYWCLCDEIGVEGTLHTHVYLVFQNPVMFSTIQRRFYGAHIEQCKGSNQENRDYVRKEGKWANDPKHGTNLPDTFEESGPLPPEPQKRMRDSDGILAMIHAGSSDASILEVFPSAYRSLRQIAEARQAIRSEEFRKIFRQLHVVYLWGQTGIGKTRGIMERHGYENVYRVTNYNHPFDSYAGEDVMLFDEFRSSLSISDMLSYLDGYPLLLPCRYADKTACYTKVYVVSNIPLEAQYPDVQAEEPATWAAFLRRFHEHYELLPPDSSDAPF